MGIEMVYLNPNITKEQADKMVATVNAERKGILNKFMEDLEGKPPELQNKILADCMPIITAFLL